MTISEERGKPPGARTARPIVYFLVLLALVAFLPVMAFSAVLLQRNNQAQQEIVQTLILATTDAVGQAVDQQISGMITTLKGFSTAPIATDDDLKLLETRGSYALTGTGAYLVLIDSDFGQVFNTRFPFGTPLGKASDPALMQKVFDTGQIVISDVVYGAAAKAWVLPVFMPVTSSAGKRYLLVVTQNASTLGAALLSRQMPDGWHLALVDAQNKVIAATQDARLTPGDAFFIDRAPASEGQKGWRHVTIDDRDYVSINSTSTDTGWRVVAWAPAAAVERPLSNSLLLLIGGGFVIVAAATVATFFLAREITRSVRWLARDARRLGAGEAVQPRDYPIAEIVEVAAAIAQAAQRRHAAETEVRFLMRELAHRSKNQMTVIAAMAKQTARGADSVPEFVASFEKRIFGLARSTDLLLANGVAGVDLEELLTSQVTPFCPIDGERVEIAGPSVRLNNQAAQILGMAAHELATNAAKYGAFAGESGRLSLTWSIAGDRVAVLWREKLPALTPRPERRGFGTTVIESMVGAALGADVLRTMHPDGIEWRFDIPRSSMDPNGTPRDNAEAARGTGASSDSKPATPVA